MDAHGRIRTDVFGWFSSADSAPEPWGDALIEAVKNLTQERDRQRDGMRRCVDLVDGLRHMMNAQQLATLAELRAVVSEAAK